MPLKMSSGGEASLPRRMPTRSNWPSRSIIWICMLLTRLGTVLHFSHPDDPLVASDTRGCSVPHRDAVAYFFGLQQRLQFLDMLGNALRDHRVRYRTARGTPCPRVPACPQCLVQRLLNHFALQSPAGCPASLRRATSDCSLGHRRAQNRPSASDRATASPASAVVLACGERLDVLAARFENARSRRCPAA